MREDTQVQDAVQVNRPDLAGRRTALEHQGLGGTFSLRSLDVDRDLDLLHFWMNDPVVAEYWNKPWSRTKSSLTCVSRSAAITPVLIWVSLTACR